MSDTTALIVAGGRGVRAGGGDLPKQYREIGGVPVIRLTLERFLSHPRRMTVLAVIGAGDADLFEAVAPRNERLLPWVAGGASRQESVRNGLLGLAADPPLRVLIHDAVRPFASDDLIGRVLAGLDDADAVLPASPVTATLKSVDPAGLVTGTVSRDALRTAETPQGFRFDAILDAHDRAAGAGLDFTDDAAVAEWAGIPVRVADGESGNIKLTTAEEIAAADRRLRAEAALARGDVRVGTGYDVHAFGPGDSVALGGLVLPHSLGVSAHSDGDVALHALTDAVLGALAEGDIGDHFPPSDPQWKDVSSDRFLAFAAGRVAARGGVIASLDVTIVTEAPRISAHRLAMRQRIAAICGISVDRVAVKATTNERLGFIGRGEGLAATATATIRLPFAGDRP
ncbi:MAG: bifunctional 2-C-methyl-D-erythritol 4-phosphate cytidylyltransferase/2-C-methyl-D-erythritol 2,4-cyclodiphosphate synthase [Bauldia sp.]|uniref:bifunctional 2-C-methyl-D-erythritol 4-phosphate cytidylyltransferase/2-C-methyl-D-erythritol 2,4-cyclodiphosphate synthase n=1 Tax=Bauldia sp. TaxID=2575872 RepID=UPI001DDE35AF|nr:bifunctional 2-C-methyl-D-erythritol 4-phosphate cytidylyltransferase/2-C-methyl-D-erythritol 2,4-cyclodiphosphate synthase [Bauldia sp.]MCB1497097.1 bifunctional 2-C-methyl-D-erythritol 4-phosphate cytidylyltransferase/2-C-methyl-D-erythritol 2,4-cyclodiphosphate synthase [Bauldia sp.]